MDESQNLQSEEKARTLYVRLPKTIRDDKEITSLFPENVKVKLPRQTSRCCHVVFPTKLEMERCQKRMKKKSIDGKKLLLIPLSVKKLDKRKEKVKRKKEAQKKVSIPLPKVDIVQSLYVTNIPSGTSVEEIKTSFPGCVTLALLKGEPQKPRSAVIKMGSVKLASAYLHNEIPAPLIKGNRVKIRPHVRRTKLLKKKLENLLEKIDKSDSDDEQESDKEIQT